MPDGEVARRVQQRPQEQRAKIDEIEVLANHRLGELLKGIEKANGRFRGGSKMEPPDDKPTLADLGVTKKQSSHSKGKTSSDTNPARLANSNGI